MALYMTIVMGGTPIGSPDHRLGRASTSGPAGRWLGGGLLTILGVVLALALFAASRPAAEARRAEPDRGYRS